MKTIIATLQNDSSFHRENDEQQTVNDDIDNISCTTVNDDIHDNKQAKWVF